MGYEPEYMSDLEEKIVRYYLTELEKHGWLAVEANDGDEFFKISGIDNALEVIDSVCESGIRFHKPGVGRAAIWFVVGNEEDVISDYTIKHDEFAAICDACMEWASELET